MAIFPEIKRAIEEVCNEAVVNDEKNVPVQINLDNSDIPRGIKKAIEEEFDYVLSLLEFNQRGYETFREWYIDSRIAYHKMIDFKKPKEGVQELRLLDPRRLLRVKEIERVKDSNQNEFPRVKEEYFLYFQTPVDMEQRGYGFSSTAVVDTAEAALMTAQALKILPDSIALATSGLIDRTSNIIYGHLQSAVKPYNQLSRLEDSLVIYRLSRSSEKLVFYVDVNGLPPAKQAEHVRNMQAMHKNNIKYDAISGDVLDDRKYMAMQENYWLPRRGDGKSAQIDKLDGAQNLGEIEDVNYFKNKLMEALNVPMNRFKEEGAALIGMGNNAEVSQADFKFTKYITRLRTQFNTLFYDLLKSQLVLKKIVHEEEWDELKGKIHFDWLQNSYAQEAKEADLFKTRIETLNFAKDFIGVYYSRAYVRKQILKQTDDEIETMDKEIKKERAEDKKNGINPDGTPIETTEGEEGFGGDEEDKPKNIKELEDDESIGEDDEDDGDEDPKPKPKDDKPDGKRSKKRPGKVQKRGSGKDGDSGDGGGEE